MTTQPKLDAAALLKGTTPGPWEYEYTNADSSGGGQWYELRTADGNSLLWRRYNCGDAELAEAEANAILLTSSKQLAAEHAELTAENAGLREKVYVPGAWRCAKCNLRIVSSVMSALSGNMSANNEPHECPNNCGPMWRVTEREDRQEAQRSFNEQFDKLQAATAENARLAARVAELELEAASLKDSIAIKNVGLEIAIAAMEA